MPAPAEYSFVREDTMRTVVSRSLRLLFTLAFVAVAAHPLLAADRESEQEREREREARRERNAVQSAPSVAGTVSSPSILSVRRAQVNVAELALQEARKSVFGRPPVRPRLLEEEIEELMEDN